MQSGLEILTEALPCRIGIYPWENPTLSTWLSRGCSRCYRHRIPVGFGISCTSKCVKRMKCSALAILLTSLSSAARGFVPPLKGGKGIWEPPSASSVFSAFSLSTPKRQTGKKNPRSAPNPSPSQDAAPDSKPWENPWCFQQRCNPTWS